VTAALILNELLEIDENIFSLPEWNNAYRYLTKRELFNLPNPSFYPNFRYIIAYSCIFESLKFNYQ
jgi:hypothetical protein